MDTIVVMVAPSDGNGVIGPVILIVIFLLLTAGLVVVIRLLLARLSGSRLPRGRQGGEIAGRAAAPGDEAHGGSGTEERVRRPLTGRVLKERYLTGKISRAEYDEQLRRLQIEEFLEDEG